MPPKGRCSGRLCQGEYDRCSPNSRCLSPSIFWLEDTDGRHLAERRYGFIPCLAGVFDRHRRCADPQLHREVEQRVARGQLPDHRFTQEVIARIGGDLFLRMHVRDRGNT